MKSTKIVLLAAVAAAVSATAPVPARAQMLDVAALAQGIIEQIQLEMQTEAGEAKQEAAEQMQEQMGQLGTAVNIDLIKSIGKGDLGSLSGLQPLVPSEFQSAITDPGNLTSATQDYMFLDPSQEMTPDVVRAVRQRREQAMRSATLQGYTLAMHSREQAGRAQEASENNTSQASGADDMRGIVIASTGLMTQMVRQLAHMNAVLASRLEVTAAMNLASDSSLSANSDGTVPTQEN